MLRQCTKSELICCRTRQKFQKVVVTKGGVDTGKAIDSWDIIIDGSFYQLRSIFQVNVKYYKGSRDDEEDVAFLAENMKSRYRKVHRQI